MLAEARGGDPDVLRLASGSAVSLCLRTMNDLAREGIRARVVSMPSGGLFRAAIEVAELQRTFGFTTEHIAAAAREAIAAAKEQMLCSLA